VFAQSIARKHRDFAGRLAFCGYGKESAAGTTDANASEYFLQRSQSGNIIAPRLLCESSTSQLEGYT
jgi:hypothetical protein